MVPLGVEPSIKPSEGSRRIRRRDLDDLCSAECADEPLHLLVTGRALHRDSVPFQYPAHSAGTLFRPISTMTAGSQRGFLG